MINRRGRMDTAATRTAALGRACWNYGRLFLAVVAAALAMQLIFSGTAFGQNSTTNFTLDAGGAGGTGGGASEEQEDPEELRRVPTGQMELLVTWAAVVVAVVASA
jgi:hypothetical protein